jgi:hypothetical protein
MSDERGAVIEIVERRKKPEHDSVGASICVPNEVRINGQRVAIPLGEPIVVNDINAHDNVAMVTLTVFARRIFVGHEDIDSDTTDEVAAATQALLDARREVADSQRRAVEAVMEAQDRLAKAQSKLTEATR